MTFMTKAMRKLIRTDTAGRMRASAAQREILLREFGCSGLSASKFSELAGIKHSTFANWLRKRRKQVAGIFPVQPADPVRWLEAVIQEVKVDVANICFAIVAQSARKSH
jgi:hypothetical protein